MYDHFDFPTCLHLSCASSRAHKRRRCPPTAGARSLEPRMRVQIPSPIPCPCRPAARTSVFQAAQRGCNSRHGYQIDHRAQRASIAARAGAPSRLISADARVRFPQLRPSSAPRSASGEAMIACSTPARDPFVARTNAGFDSLHCDRRRKQIERNTDAIHGRCAGSGARPVC